MIPPSQTIYICIMGVKHIESLMPDVHFALMKFVGDNVEVMDMNHTCDEV